MRTLTEADIAADPEPAWGIGRASVYTHINGQWLQPSCYQARMASAHKATVWFGPNDDIVPQDYWEGVATAPADEDWIDVDTSFTKVVPENIPGINTNGGSLLGGRVRKVDSEGQASESTPPISWYYGTASVIDERSIGLHVNYRPPQGVTAEFEMSTLDMDGLPGYLAGEGIVLRARAKQVWKEFSTPRSKQTGADDSLSGVRIYTHDGGWHIQSPRVMDKVLTRLGQMYAQPLPAHDEVRLVTPDPAITRASTITLSLDAYRTPQRVTAIRWEGGPDGVRQTLGLRQIHPATE